MTCCALAVNWANDHASAILEAWYAGEEGGTAIAETLAGGNNPGGRLPVTFYKSVEQLPPFDDYAMKNRMYRYFTGQLLYPFGDGQLPPVLPVARERWRALAWQSGSSAAWAEGSGEREPWFPRIGCPFLHGYKG
jgi:beta-glucosidase